jgi:hypothetical protein
MCEDAAAAKDSPIISRGPTANKVNKINLLLPPRNSLQRSYDLCVHMMGKNTCYRGNDDVIGHSVPLLSEAKITSAHPSAASPPFYLLPS